MSEKKLFSDPRWWAPFPVKVVGQSPLTKEDEIEVLDYLFEVGDVSVAEYQKRLTEIEKKYAV